MAHADITPEKSQPSYVSKNINYSSRKRLERFAGNGKKPVKRGGRPKGAKNIVQRTTREMLVQFVEKNMAGAQTLYDQVAKTKPEKALAILGQFSEFVLPKLNRTEMNVAGAPVLNPAPVNDAADAANIYLAILGNTNIDLTVIKFEPPAHAPIRDDSVVAICERMLE